MRRHTTGFTLIELLVVISIIGVLSTVVLSNLNTARSKARNAQRTNAIRQLITAFNLGLNSNNSFPIASTPAGWACVASSCYGSPGNFYPPDAAVTNFLVPTNIPVLPSDPPEGTRIYGGQGFGGYNYDGNFAGGSYTDTLGNDYSFAPGSVLDYSLEGGASTCAIGKIDWRDPVYVSCMVYLN